MKFRIVVELDGPILFSRLKQYEPPPFNLTTPLPIQVTISCGPPTGHEPSKAKLVFSSCTTTGELSQNKYGEYLRSRLELPLSEKWVNFSTVPKDEADRVYEEDEEVDKFIVPLRASSLRLVRLIRTGSRSRLSGTTAKPRLSVPRWKFLVIPFRCTKHDT